MAGDNLMSVHRQQKAEMHRRAERIVEIWAGGGTSRDIAREFGISVSSAKNLIGRTRQRGYDLPYRKPESVEHARMLRGVRKERETCGTCWQMGREEALAEVAAREDRLREVLRRIEATTANPVVQRIAREALTDE